MTPFIWNVFLSGLPFFVYPLTPETVPLRSELSRDTGVTWEETQSFAWINANTLENQRQIATDTYQKRVFQLNESKQVTQVDNYSEFSDSLIDMDTYTYANGSLSAWQGTFESALCFYRNGMLDSVHIDYHDANDSQQLYYKYTYDSLGRIAYYDRIVTVPNNNPSPPRRYQYLYFPDSVVKQDFYLTEAKDTNWTFYQFQNGVPILERSASKGSGRIVLRRHTYAPTTGMHSVWKKKKRRTQIDRSIDLMGRRLLPQVPQGVSSPQVGSY